MLRFVKSGSGLDNWKMKKLIAVAIASTLLVFLSLYAVNVVIIGQQKSKQREISRTLLHYSEDVSQSVALGLKSITTHGCDKTSLQLQTV